MKIIKLFLQFCLHLHGIYHRVALVTAGQQVRHTHAVCVWWRRLVGLLVLWSSIWTMQGILPGRLYHDSDRMASGSESVDVADAKKAEVVKVRTCMHFSPQGHPYKPVGSPRSTDCHLGWRFENLYRLLFSMLLKVDVRSRVSRASYCSIKLFQFSFSSHYKHACTHYKLMKTLKPTDFD